MAKKNKGKNKHQKAAHKEREERIGREELQELLELSHSDDPKDRETAASLIPDPGETRAALVCENCDQVPA
jgi:hypothetical protein